MKTDERYLRICSILGGAAKDVNADNVIAQILSELDEGSVPLDNLIYEHMGLSGEDIIEVLQGRSV